MKNSSDYFLWNREEFLRSTPVRDAHQHRNCLRFYSSATRCAENIHQLIHTKISGQQLDRESSARIIVVNTKGPESFELALIYVAQMFAKITASYH